MHQYALTNADGLAVSRIAYGCMHLSRAWDTAPLTDAERRQARLLVETALELGITLFDHADIYARGKSERLFGEVLRAAPGLRERMVLQSKCGIRLAGDPQPGALGRYDFSPAYLLAAVDGILARLCVEQLDILLLHRPDPLAEPAQVAEVFDQLQRSGKVRHFGVSNHTAGQMALLQRHLRQPLVANQLELSLLHHGLIDAGIMANQSGAASWDAGTLDFCRLHGIRVQAWSPLAGGQLAAPGASASPAVQATAQLLRQMAQARGITPEAVQLAWLLRHPAGVQPVVGTTDPGRLRACAQADAVELSREEWYALLTAARGAPVP